MQPDANLSICQSGFGTVGFYFSESCDGVKYSRCSNRLRKIN